MKNMDITIWFDMDGTITDLYGVEDWLPKLRADDPTPYTDAKPLVNMNRLARYLNKVQKLGYTIGIISWGSKQASDEYLSAIAKAKREWLKKHLKSVKFNNIEIVPYGTPKHSFCMSTGIDILFDDDGVIRQDWTTHGIAYNETMIFPILQRITKGKFLA